MRTIVGLVITLVCLGGARLATAEDGAPPDWPKSVAEAVQILKGRFVPAELDWIRSNPQDDVVAQLHLPFGTGVRNEFGLWGRNQALLESCGTKHAEACSSIIFSTLWDSVRAEVPPARARELDCQFSAVDDIPINTKGFFEQRIGEVLARIQSQIDLQTHAGAHLGCAAPMRLTTQGDVDLNCWTRFEFEGWYRLAEFLGWFDFRNGARVQHDPPNIVLVFHERCAWPAKPKGFEPRSISTPHERGAAR